MRQLHRRVRSAEEVPGDWLPAEGDGETRRQDRGAVAATSNEQESVMPKQPRMPNVQQMMAQVQKMQDMSDMELAPGGAQARDQVEASAGGGAVVAIVMRYGDLQVEARCGSTRARGGPGATPEILGEMGALAAVNEALRMAQELAERKMGGATAGLDMGALGGLGLPGL